MKTLAVHGILSLEVIFFVYYLFVSVTVEILFGHQVVLEKNTCIFPVAKLKPKNIHKSFCCQCVVMGVVLLFSFQGLE